MFISFLTRNGGGIPYLRNKSSVEGKAVRQGVVSIGRHPLVKKGGSSFGVIISTYISKEELRG